MRVNNSEGEKIGPIIKHRKADARLHWRTLLQVLPGLHCPFSETFPHTGSVKFPKPDT